MRVGDLVRYLDEENPEIGMVVRIRPWRPILDGEIRQIDVLWNDGVGAHFNDEVEVIDESR